MVAHLGAFENHRTRGIGVALHRLDSPSPPTNTFHHRYRRRYIWYQVRINIETV